VVTEFLSLDGVYQGPGAPDEDTEGGFRHCGWQMPYADDVLGEMAAEGMAHTDAQLFGRKTYEIMAAYWPSAPSDDPYAQEPVRHRLPPRRSRPPWHRCCVDAQSGGPCLGAPVRASPGHAIPPDRTSNGNLTNVPPSPPPALR
jgi:hypothetical protein